MRSRNSGDDTLDRILAEARHERERRGNVWRDRAMVMWQSELGAARENRLATKRL